MFVLWENLRLSPCAPCSCYQFVTVAEQPRDVATVRESVIKSARRTVVDRVFGAYFVDFNADKVLLNFSLSISLSILKVRDTFTASFVSL